MIWVGALQKTGSLSRLEPFEKDVRAVTVFTHTFVMGGQDGLADDREDPFFTASAATPEEAEAQAHAVYLKAISCSHNMKRRVPMLLECTMCGVQQRTTLAHPAPAKGPSAPLKEAGKGRKPQRGGLFSWLRSA